jgi:glycosyltransferase involved in cell wall biosynthesis
MPAVLCNFINFPNSLSYKSARKIICVTKKLAELLSKKYNMEKVVYIPPAISVYSNIKRENCEEANIFFIARDISLPRKNFNTFCRVLMKLDRLYNAGHIKVHIIGKTKITALKSIKSLKNLKVILHGYLDRAQIMNLYNSASRPIYVSTSIYEEFNYSLLEALSKGSVAVVSNISAHRDQVIDYQTGFLCNPYDELSFFNRIRMLIDDIELYNRL